jgi:uncharacterized protein YaeQ
VANPSTLYRFKISLSDVDRGVYEELDLRVAMHPSENEDYLLTRVLAYALNFEDGLEFSQGLCVPDEPAIRIPDPMNGGVLKWIDIGNPAAKRLHKASKAARSVRVYTYKDPENLKREAAGESIHRAGEIEVFSLDPRFLKQLAAILKRDNSWGVIHDEGELAVTVGEQSFATTLGKHRLEDMR